MSRGPPASARAAAEMFQRPGDAQLGAARGVGFRMFGNILIHTRQGLTGENFDLSWKSASGGGTGPTGGVEGSRWRRESFDVAHQRRDEGSGVGAAAQLVGRWYQARGRSARPRKPCRTGQAESTQKNSSQLSPSHLFRCGGAEFFYVVPRPPGSRCRPRLRACACGPGGPGSGASGRSEAARPGRVRGVLPGGRREIGPTGRPKGGHRPESHPALGPKFGKRSTRTNVEGVWKSCRNRVDKVWTLRRP